MQSKIVISHPTGNENTRAAVNGLYKFNVLESFHTSIACFKGSCLYALTFLPGLKKIRRREFDKVLKPYTHCYPWKELIRNLPLKSCKYVNVDNVYYDLDKKVATYLHKHRDEIDAVYAYDDGAFHSFVQAHKDGIKCFFDLPIIHWRTYQSLLKNEEIKNPQWAATLGVFGDSLEKLTRKDEELKMADCIMVASSFTKQSIVEDFPYHLNAEICVIPYGFPAIYSKRCYEPTDNRRLKFLFVGRLSQSKGLSYLFEAMESFKDAIDLTIVGSGNIDSCSILKEKLAQHKYIPYLSHDDVLREMRKNDVFIFPSLFEGFGMVITEAMSQGTPVLTTNRTCGRDFIKDEENGWLVQPASVDDLKNKLRLIIERKDRLEFIGRAAMKTASERPWSKYEQELISVLKSKLYDWTASRKI